MRIPKKLRKAAIRAHDRHTDWADFHREHHKAIEAAVIGDQVRRGRLESALMTIVQLGTKD